MIYAIIGPQGAGKTATLTYWGLKDYGLAKPVYANYDLEFPHVPIVTPKDLINLEGPCTILVSEAQMWFSSLIPVTSPIYHATQAILVRARRRDWDLILDTQRFKNLNNRLRNVTHYIMTPTPCPIWTWDNPHTFEVDLWDYNTDDLLNTFYYPLESVADLYFTKREPYGFDAYFREISKMLDDYELIDFYAPRKKLRKRMVERGVSWENEPYIRADRHKKEVEASI